MLKNTQYKALTHLKEKTMEEKTDHTITVPEDDKCSYITCDQLKEYAEDMMGLTPLSTDMMDVYEHAKYITGKYYKQKQFDMCLYCKTPCLKYKELCGPCTDLRELGMLIREYGGIVKYRKATVQERKWITKKKENGLS